MTRGCSDTVYLYFYESPTYRKHFNVKFAIKNMTKKILWRDMFGLTTALQKNIIHENGWA